MGKRACQKGLRSTPNLQNEQVQLVENLASVARRKNMVTLEAPTVNVLKSCVEDIIKRKDKNMAFALCKQLKEFLDEQTKQKGE